MRGSEILTPTGACHFARQPALTRSAVIDVGATTGAVAASGGGGILGPSTRGQSRGQAAAVAAARNEGEAGRGTRSGRLCRWTQRRQRTQRPSLPPALCRISRRHHSPRRPSRDDSGRSGHRGGRQRCGVRCAAVGRAGDRCAVAPHLRVGAAGDASAAVAVTAHHRLSLRVHISLPTSLVTLPPAARHSLRLVPLPTPSSFQLLPSWLPHSLPTPPFPPSRLSPSTSSPPSPWRLCASSPSSSSPLSSST